MPWGPLTPIDRLRQGRLAQRGFEANQGRDQGPQPVASSLLFTVEFTSIAAYAREAGVSVPQDTMGVNIGFSRLTGIGKELVVTEYMEGTSGRPVKVPRGMRTEPVILSKALVSRLEYTLLVGWFKRAQMTAEGEYNTDFGDEGYYDFVPTDDVRITVPMEHRYVLEPAAKIDFNYISRESKVQILLRGAWPSSLKIGSLDSMRSDVLISELTLQYDDFDYVSADFNESEFA